MRLPQEDLCQATGTPPGLQYESDGGPGIVRIMRILLGAQDPLSDRRRFFEAQILFWLLAAPDGHTKNFSLSIQRAGRYSLAPLYDMMSAYPLMGREASRIAPERLKMAMAVFGKNPHYAWRQISLRRWRVTGSRCDMGTGIDALVAELLDRIPHALSVATSGLPDDFPDSVATSIVEGVRAASIKLRHELNSGE